MAAHYYDRHLGPAPPRRPRAGRRLMERGPFRGIVAITRGGLIPAAIIARELEVRLVESVSIVAYGQGGARSRTESAASRW